MGDGIAKTGKSLKVGISKDKK